MAKFELAIRGSEQEGFLREQEAALTCEQAGFWLLELMVNEKAISSKAILYSQGSQDLYESWGSRPKVEQMVPLRKIEGVVARGIFSRLIAIVITRTQYSYHLVAL